MRCEQIGPFVVLPVTKHPVYVINQFIWQKTDPGFRKYGFTVQAL